MATDGTEGIDRTERTAVIALWGARIAWIALALLGGAAFGDALADHSRAVQQVGTIGLWAGWAVVALALATASTRSLTIVRTVVPAAVVAAIVAAFGNGSGVDRVVCIALTILAAALVSVGEFGQRFVQASAYGDEARFVLRPPIAYLVPTIVSWCALCAAALAGPLLVAARSWILGIVLTALAVVSAWFLGRRYHRLSCRWLVLVPAGVVVHDHLVLAETVMFPRNTLGQVGLALAGTEAADLTGPAAGMAIEIVLTDVPTIVLAPTRAAPRGTALHVRSVLIAPTRPGRVMAEVTRRRFPT